MEKIFESWRAAVKELNQPPASNTEDEVINEPAAGAPWPETDDLSQKASALWGQLNELLRLWEPQSEEGTKYKNDLMGIMAEFSGNRAGEAPTFPSQALEEQ